jgi:hypothetical protein
MGLGLMCRYANMPILHPEAESVDVDGYGGTKWYDMSRKELRERMTVEAGIKFDLGDEVKWGVADEVGR